MIGKTWVHRYGFWEREQKDAYEDTYGFLLPRNDVKLAFEGLLGTDLRLQVKEERSFQEWS